MELLGESKKSEFNSPSFQGQQKTAGWIIATIPQPKYKRMKNDCCQKAVKQNEINELKRNIMGTSY